MKSIDVDDLNMRLKTNDIQLLDVREAYELEIAKIKNCLHIPMMDVPNRVVELNKEKDIAVICHSGIRSSQVCVFLKQKGFSVYNVLGGIDMWSEKIDPSIKKY